jgi:hypothetical protein
MKDLCVGEVFCMYLSVLILLRKMNYTYIYSIEPNKLHCIVNLLDGI